MEGFDVDAYYTAIDHERQHRQLTWAGLVRELNAPFAHRPDIPPIAASTITGMRFRGGLNGNIVVHVLMWLGQTPEDFTPGHPVAGTALPPLTPGRLPRWDAEALHRAVDQRRQQHGLTWVGLATELGPFFTPATLRSVRKGVGFPHVMKLLAWLDRPAGDFVVNVAV